MEHRSLKTLRNRFDEKWMPEPNTGCWLWTAANNRGYGLIGLSAKEGPVSAHSVAMYLYRGVPLWTSNKDMHWDHVCRTPSCVNPDHLRLISNKENVLCGNGPSAKNLKKTHCNKGHEFTLQNTAIRTRSDGRKLRRCRECEKIQSKSYHERNREKCLANLKKRWITYGPTYNEQRRRLRKDLREAPIE